MSRTVGDLYCVVAAAAHVGKRLVENQRDQICLHVKTSSLLNPTPVIHAYHNNHHGAHHSDTPATSHSSVAAQNMATDQTAKSTVPEPEALGATELEATAFKPEPPAIDIKSPPSTPKTTSTASTNSSFINQTSTPDEKRLTPDSVFIDETLASATDTVTPPPPEARKVLKESRIPTTRFGRLWQYGTLATGLGVGAVNESLKRATGLSSNKQGSAMLSKSNVDLLVDKISRMRGAALKMGQMLSIQGIQAAGESESWIPPEMEQILLRVHDSANYMPKKQMERVMTKELGSDWQSQFSNFDPVPIAAASIGQVHAASLDGKDVVVKIQYPGVAEAIDSDLNNLKAIVTFSNLLPRGLYLDNTIKVAKEELAWECDYIREANNTIRYGELLAGDERYKVPKVYKDMCTPRVLVLERLQGRVLSKATEESQDLRDKLGEHLLRLCLREVFSFRFMQTDPNWSNFFYDRNKGSVELLDFGACREFGDIFLASYGQILKAAARGDRNGVWEWSEKLGFVTGYETGVMREAHIDSVMTLGEPFRHDAPDVFDFSSQTITARVRETVPVMLRHRLTPPPDETYGLHKKLSGAFLLCTKLGSRFDTKAIWREEVERVFR
ncbi:ABC1 family-domain-containing protein [Syncephalastrum racemosum]|uniref:ABC1 family-domain-containing protein n=1 Tax=Syncephalastrum racemosum TaxID=13706 RepID=A0A1X2HG29_SYNRA|nr:ABC1 family-domain-containing protein [Syncephalastrum racemosum]